MDVCRIEHAESHVDGPKVKKLIARIKRSLKSRRRSCPEIRNESLTNITRSNSTCHRYISHSPEVPARNRIKSCILATEEQNCISYKFTRRKMGYALFIVNSTFDRQNPRPFADNDCRNMTELFRALGFETKILKNKPTNELMKCLIDIRNSVGEDHDCVAVVISSHGAEIPLSRHTNREQKLRQHIIYTKDAWVPTEDILKEFDNDHCPNLVDKPKMFFIQACRCAEGVDERFDVDAGCDIKIKYTSDTRIVSPVYSYANETTVPYTDRAVTMETEDKMESRSDTKGQPDPSFTINELNVPYLRQTQRQINKCAITPNRRAVNQNNNYNTTMVTPEESDSVCVIPCSEDFLVMFSSSSGRLGWSDSGKGGWLMHCLYKVFEKLLDTNYEKDLLQILTDVCGKMSRELESYCPSKKNYHRTKSAAVVYHMLTKDLYVRPKVETPICVTERYPVVNTKDLYPKHRVERTIPVRETHSAVNTKYIYLRPYVDRTFLVKETYL